MNTKSVFGKRFWCIYIAGGLLLFGVVIFFSVQADVRSCESRLAATLDFIKEQSASYVKYNHTTVAKSLVREATAVHALEGCTFDCSAEDLEEYAQRLWLTGISILDAEGNLVCEYTEDGVGYARFQSETKQELLLSVIDFPKKTYVKRIEMEDGSCVDIAVHSCADDAGAVLAYRHTKAEFSQRSVLSVQDLLDGYDVNAMGTLLLVKENRVEASNAPDLIGMDISENRLLQSIRGRNQADRLIHVNTQSGLDGYYCGMYSHGRDYYLYTYIPACQVYQVTTSNLAAALIAYILLLLLMQALRWNSEKSFKLQQEKREQEYKKSLEQKNAELELAIWHETAANRAKREFLFNMSHDIRTPMNAIIGFTSLAETHIQNQEQVLDYLKKIATASRHLLSLINDVLDMSRIESGRVMLETRPVHLPELVRELQDIIQSGIADKRLSFSVDLADIVNEDLIADPMRLNQILLNILSNAVKFTQPGGAIALRIAQIHPSPEGFADYVFRIRDNGIGMSEAFRAHIFEQFAREKTSTVSKIQGTGLGMSITKSLVDMMGGTITVESEPGKGSEFVVSLRFPVSKKREDSEQTHRQAAPMKASFSGKRLLVVEDNALNMEIATTVLREAGFDVDTAENGRIAVEKVRSSPEKYYDAILMDIQMPEMNGYEAAERIRALPEKGKAEIPILAMTANAFEEDRKNALDAGMNEHISKPIDVELLLSILQAVLKC